VFHDDAAVLGRPVGMSGSPYTIVGVVRDLDFELPVGGSTTGSGFTIADVDVWLPLDSRESLGRSRAVSTYQAIVKLEPQQTVDAAQRGVDMVASNLARAYPSTNRNRGFRLVPLHQQIVQTTSQAVWIGFAGALLILVIACANLASLFAGELPARRRDFALREALGASRGRLLRQVAIESLLLSGASAATGVVGSSTPAIVRIVCGEAIALAVVGTLSGSAIVVAASRVIQSQLFGIAATDPRAIAATAMMLVLVGALATWVPARRAARIDPAIALREE